MGERATQTKEIQTSVANSVNTNDVSFSIPEWRHQQLQSINKDYQKKIYTAVSLSLTDFNQSDEIQFMSKPQKPKDQQYAYERRLLHAEDFSILAFILCFQQTLMGNSETKQAKIQKFKKKISDLDLCCFEEVPPRVQKQYKNAVLKKILFQYINKGSYNVSLLEILLRKNSLLKFALSLVSKAILKNNSLVEKYQDTVNSYVQMKMCGSYFDVIPAITIKERSIQSQNFYVSIDKEILIYRKQNIIKKQSPEKLKKLASQKGRRAKTPSTSQHRLSKNSQTSQKQSKKNSKITAHEQYFGSKKDLKLASKNNSTKRPSSVSHFFRKFICFS